MLYCLFVFLIAILFAVLFIAIWELLVVLIYPPAATVNNLVRLIALIMVLIVMVLCLMGAIPMLPLYRHP